MFVFQDLCNLLILTRKENHQKNGRQIHSHVPFCDNLRKELLNWNQNNPKSLCREYILYDEREVVSRSHHIFDR